jgi:hypothetical protein
VDAKLLEECQTKHLDRGVRYAGRVSFARGKGNGGYSKRWLAIEIERAKKCMSFGGGEGGAAGSSNSGKRGRASIRKKNKKKRESKARRKNQNHSGDKGKEEEFITYLRVYKTPPINGNRGEWVSGDRSFTTKSAASPPPLPLFSRILSHASAKVLTPRSLEQSMNDPMMPKLGVGRSKYGFGLGSGSSSGNKGDGGVFQVLPAITHSKKFNEVFNKKKEKEMAKAEKKRARTRANKPKPWYVEGGDENERWRFKVESSDERIDWHRFLSVHLEHPVLLKRLRRVTREIEGRGKTFEHDW